MISLILQIIKIQKLFSKKFIDPSNLSLKHKQTHRATHLFIYFWIRHILLGMQMHRRKLISRILIGTQI